MYHIFSIHSSSDRYLDGFHVLAIVNSTAVNIGVHVSFFFFLFRAAPVAYGGSQARCGIEAVAAGLCNSYSNDQI